MVLVACLIFLLSLPTVQFGNLVSENLTLDNMADFTPDELRTLGEAFKSLGVKPKADSPEDLEGWMKEYVEQKGPKTPSVHVHAQLPRIVVFSGEPKGDQVSFDVWKYDVKCLINEGLHKGPEIYQAARKSLRGEASRIAMRLGSKASIRDLIDKLDGIYGIVEAGENLLAQFYSAFQKPDEDVAAWGCRLEDILEKAVEQEQVQRTAVVEMLHNKFWMGLKQQLKDATRHNFENIKDFDKLRVQIRRVEHELMLSSGTINDMGKKDKKSAQVKMVSAVQDGVSQPLSDIEQLKAMVCNLSKKVDVLQDHHVSDNKSSHIQNTPQTLSLASDQQSAKWVQNTGSQKPWGSGSQNTGSQKPWGSDKPTRGRGRGRGQHNFWSGGSGHRVDENGSWQQGQDQRDIAGRSRGMSFQNRGRGQFPQQQRTNWEFRNDNFSQVEEPQCWRCGQLGHLQYGCRVILDHQKPLN